MNTLEIVSDEHDASLGTLLCGRYRIDALLGRGAMGAVYRAWDTQRLAACAIKLLRVDSEVKDAASRRFADEGRLVRQIFHPNIVEVFDQGICEDGTLFLVMELLSGQDLDALLSEKPRLSLSQTQDIVYQVGSALHAVHQVGIVHRDIKPRNIFLLSPSAGAGGWESPRIKVIDFGLAKYLEERHVSRGSDGMLIGTPEYLAPEAWTGVSEQVDTRVDQWALAVLAFRLLAGCLPFDGQLDTLHLGREIVSGTPRSLRELVPDVPEYVERALLRAMAKSKEDRFPSIRDFVCAFTHRPLNASMLFSGDTAIRPAPIEPPDAAETRRIAIERPIEVRKEAPSAMRAADAEPLVTLAPGLPLTDSAVVAATAVTVGPALADDPLATCMLVAATERVPPPPTRPPEPRLRPALPWLLHAAQTALTLSLGAYLWLSAQVQPVRSEPPRLSVEATQGVPACLAKLAEPVAMPLLVPAADSVPHAANATSAKARPGALGTSHGPRSDGGMRAPVTAPGADKPAKRRVSAASQGRDLLGVDPFAAAPESELRPWASRRSAASRQPSTIQ